MNAVLAEVPTKPKLIERLADKYGVDADKFLATLKATVFKGNISNEQMMAMLVVAEQYGLNPWTKEIYAFPDKSGGIIPVVGVDGWGRIINEHPQCDGITFQEGPINELSKLPEWIECTIHRKDRKHPTTVREYFEEVNRSVGAWQSHPRRMMRHKAFIQAGRIVFGFAGIYDPDEAQAIIDATPRDLGPRPDTSEVDMTLRDQWVGRITDTLNVDKSEYEMAAMLREADAELNQFPELYSSVFDQLASQKIISKANWRKYLAIMPPPEDGQIP